MTEPKNMEKKKYDKPQVEHTEKIDRVFLACRSAIGGCTETLQQAGTCPP
ncbi:MAG: hypothetical protein GF409_07280 [Candidatus Omnitrophica bacterium]|nr:hypothetical protein [Candidatus Omnitrophota bacterium]